ncbi:MAG TPA: SPOR domain-containing protein [Gemmatimonadales bacterium]|nr:SPOR domain-containing protein [Gemmatimonadales bacterium]
MLEGRSLVTLVVRTDDLAWASKAAWDIARIAARDGRRIALVDMNLERPVLHELVGMSPTEGIVDAFEYGVSLNKAAHEVTGVFFIPAGSETGHASEIYAHPRWPKLQAGFRSEGALMLVFVSLAGLSQLAALADGALVLAPDGVGPTFSLGRDIPLLGVVRDRWLPSANQRMSPAPGPLPIAVEPTKPRRLRPAFAAIAVLGLAVGGWALLAGARESFIAKLVAPRPAAPLPPPSSTVTHQPPPPVVRDTLGWTIQLAAYASLDKALTHADRLAADAGVPTLVTPVPQTKKGPVWYRVLAGSYATRAVAATARAGLWRRGVINEGIGDLLLAPYSYHAPADASLESLRRHGLPAVRWSNGAILMGAFEGPDQATAIKKALTRAGVRANLLPRMGTP